MTIDETELVADALTLRDGTMATPGVMVMTTTGHTGTYLGLYKGGVLIADWTVPGNEPVAHAVLCRNCARGALLLVRRQ